MLAMVAGCIGCDQETKHLAVETLRFRAPIELLHGNVKLLYAENSGAWGSLGAGWSGPLKSLVFIALPALVLLMVLVQTLRGSDRRFRLLLACSLLIGGGLGNIIDRARAGYVVDFLYVGIGRIGTNIFNVADVAVVAGVLLLLLGQTRQPAPAKAP